MICPSAWRILLTEADLDLIFATVTGEPLHPDNVSGTFDRLVKGAEVRRIRLHDLRHSAATVMPEQGVPL